MVIPKREITLLKKCLYRIGEGGGGGGGGGAVVKSLQGQNNEN
jgi:hypothetical protein